MTKNREIVGNVVFIGFFCSYFLDLAFLQLELLAKPLRRGLNTVVDVLRLGALALSRGLLASGAAANDLGDGGSPLLGGDALRRKVL
jgi:hypothetical protein